MKQLFFRYEPILVQEMLTLIIQVVNERRFCGLTVAESLKRELIYKLAIGDATHSQLVKALPRDLSKCHQLQEILDTIAVYSNPSGFNQVMPFTSLGFLILIFAHCYFSRYKFVSGDVFFTLEVLERVGSVPPSLEFTGPAGC